MESPSSALVSSDIVAKPGSWKQSPEASGHQAGTTGPASVPRSPFSSAAPPVMTIAGARPGAFGLLHDAAIVETRHSGGVAADSGSSEASQLASVHARLIVAANPVLQPQSRATLATVQRSGTSALPDGLSGLVASYNPDRVGQSGAAGQSQPANSATVRSSGGGAAGAHGASDPAVAVAAAAAAALNMAAERLLAAAAAVGSQQQQRQHTGLPQAPASLAAAAAAAAHLALQGASQSDAADSILAMVRSWPAPCLISLPWTRLLCISPDSS